VTTVRFQDSDSQSESARAIQTSLNDVARSVMGFKRSDKIRVGDLLESARIPSHNRLAATAIAVEAWKSFSSRDGGSGRQNPVGEIRFPDPEPIASSRPLRASAAGKIKVPLRGYSTLVGQAAEI
jgi:hypothetical protein